MSAENGIPTPQSVAEKVAERSIDRSRVMFELRLVRFRVSDRKSIMEAFDFARGVHANDFRDDGRPYMSHPMRAAMNALEIGVKDVVIINATLLHDVPEKDFSKRNKIKTEFGNEVANLVDLLTLPNKDGKKIKSKKNQLEQYKENIIKSPKASLVKTFDFLHNARTLKHRDPEKRRKNLRKMKKYYLDILENIKDAYPKEYKALSAKIKTALVEAHSSLA